MRDGDDWEHSSEGNLDPDLTEEAGYAGRDAPRRSVWPLLSRVVTIFLLISLIAPLVISLLTR